MTTEATKLLSPALLEDAVAWRQQLHRCPELGYQEHHTSAFIAGLLEGWGLKVHRGLAGTGVVGSLTRGTSQRSIGIRADMDALPLRETSGAAHASTVSGVMHACGHDGHVAILLAAARACIDLPDLDGTVHFIFQPAEEIEGGAKRMVEEGLFRLFPCEAVYALHNWPALPVGSCVVSTGPVLAAIAVFEILISGRGCHGALPHEGTDALVAGCHVVAALQSIVGRNIDPRQAAIVSATQITAGDTWNVIPSQCLIRGTTRWFEDAVGNTIEQRIHELSTTIARGFGCKAEVGYHRKGPATINDQAAALRVRDVAGAPSLNLSIVEIPPSTGAEDFAFMLQEVPGCYVLLGAGRPGANPALHSPQFDFNDDVLGLGAALWLSLIRHSLGEV